MFKKEKPEFITLNHHEKLIKKIEEIRNLVDENQDALEKNIGQIKAEINTLRENIKINRNQIEQEIKIQEEIIMDMIKKFNEEFLKNKNRLVSDIEEVKAQQDVLKISYTVNERRLLDKVKDVIREEIKEAVKDKEKEILMGVWIEELRTIITDFEKLKKMHPRDFEIQLNEISTLIQTFKKEIEIK